jgi:hypothetical protein
MDYGAAPGNDQAMVWVRNFFAHRKDTSLVERNTTITPKAIATLEDFVRHINLEVTRPPAVGSLLIGSHASSSGRLTLPLYRDPDQNMSPVAPTDYDLLQKGMSDIRITLKLDPSVFGTPPVGTHYFHIKGCNLGKAIPFLTRLKAALGGGVTVTAAKHFYGITATVKLRKETFGIFEFLCYEFPVVSPTPMANSDALIDAFKSAAQANPADYSYVNGTPVPSANWAAWVPKHTKPMKGKADVPMRDGSKKMILGKLKTPIGVIESLADIMDPLKQRREAQLSKVPFHLRIRTEDFSWSLTYPNKASVPSDEGARRNALKVNMSGSAKFTDPTFPIHKRWGYQDFDAFYAGFTWTKPNVSFDKKANKWVLAMKGTRYRYTAIVPITNPNATNINPFVDGVLTNFHADAASTQTSHIELPEPGTPGPTPAEIARFYASV